MNSSWFTQFWRKAGIALRSHLTYYRWASINGKESDKYEYESDSNPHPSVLLSHRTPPALKKKFRINLTNNKNEFPSEKSEKMTPFALRQRNKMYNMIAVSIPEVTHKQSIVYTRLCVS